jgi:DNA-binding NarL/FixJ family response regulator
MTNPAVRIAVVDNDPLYRKGLVGTISGPSLVVLAEGETAEDVVRIVREHRPDVLILEIGLLGDAIAAVKTALRTRPGLRVIFLTSSSDEDDLSDALRVGVHGYILKGVRGPELITAITAVHNGESYVTPALGARMLIQTKGKLLAPASKSGQMHLTFRDRRVLHNLARGLSNRELASELGVSVRTIKYYVSRLFRKMGVRSRFQAILETKRMQLDLSDQGHT